MGRPPIHDRPMTGAERQLRYIEKRARDHTAAAPQPPDGAVAAAELVERIKAHPHEASVWLRSKLGDEVAETIGHALVPPRGPFDHLFPMPDQQLAYAYRRGKIDEARLREVRDAIGRLLAHPPQRDWDPFRDEPP